MNKTKTALSSFVCAFVVLVSMLALLLLGANASSDAVNEDVKTDIYLAAGDEVVIMDNGVSAYEQLVYGKVTFNNGNAASEATKLEGWFYKYSKDIYMYKQSSSTATKNVVTFGRVTNVPLSVKLADAVDAYDATSFVWGIAYEDGVLALYANSKAAMYSDTSKMEDKHEIYKDLYAGLESLVKDGKIIVTEGMWVINEVTAEEYERLLEEDEIGYKEEEITLRAERKERLVSLIAALNNKDFNPSGKGYTADLYSLTGTRYAAPEKYPTANSHPRVYFNDSMIDGIIAALENPENATAAEKFWSAAESWHTGELGERVVSSSYSHNYNGSLLDTIQAKALAYVITGDTYYGHGAILMIQNFIRTLDFDGKSSDQCREFGNIMYTAACVYDWCYDLLTEDDMFRIISGVEQLIVTGSTPNEDGKIAISSSPVKMEVGFPPTGQGAATGHGSEDQILRDYLSFAIAIYDEVPGWYELIGGRFYEQYVPVRNYYYSAGLVPQGTGGYNAGRYQSDLHSAVLMLAATGENPYSDNMREVVYGLLSPVTNVTGKKVFYVGDCRPHQAGSDGLSVGTCPIISSYLFDDGLMRGVAKWLTGDFTRFDSGTSGLSVAEFIIYSSRGTVTVDDFLNELPLISYNGGWYGQIIARNEWGDDSAIILMKVQERTTANHDHAAAGTFQIYYKGMLTGDMGDYTGVAYGSDHCVYFMRATVAHNGLLIYNPSFANTQKGYYSGGQRIGLGEPTSLNSWLNNKYDTGTTTGYRYAYDFNMEPTFAYIAGDITEAYDSETVDYVGRTMLTVYTGDETMPMIFFVFDNITADSESFKKTFLLQVPGEDAPVVDRDEKTVVISNGKGKLMLQNILGGDDFTEIGGNDPTKEEPNNRLNYVVNGQQLHYYGSTYNLGSSNYVASDGESWGRVEISPNTGNKNDLMLNVIFVADDDREITEKAESFKAYSTEKNSVVMEGAYVGNVAALFSAGEKNVSEAFKFTVEGEGITKYYLGGLYRGTWRVLADGNYLGSVYSTDAAKMVTFSAPAGSEITVVPGDDIRPPNSGEVTFFLDGGNWASGKAPFEFYPLGQATDLPDASAITKADSVFQGWYSDAEFTNRITAIPTDAGEEYFVYAKWKQSPIVANADYSQSSDDTRIDLSPQAGLGSASAEDKAAAKITYNKDGYQLWQSKAGGPTIYARSTYKNYNSTQFSFEFVISRNGTDPLLETNLRMRSPVNGSDKDVTLITTKADGSVYTGGSNGSVIATVTEAPTTIRFTVDFEKGKIYYYSNEYGDVLVERSFGPPSGSTASNTLELLQIMKSDEIFSWRAMGNGNSVGAVRIHKITVLAEESFRQDVGNTVIYNTNGGKFTDSTAQMTPYDSALGLTLSTAITRDGYIFDGWYSESGLVNKVTEVPAGTTGAFPVYAKWVRHEIAYETDGGTFSSNPDLSYTPGTTKPLATNISKAGHSFLGWYTTSDFRDDTLVTEVPTDAYNTFRVYAKWIKNTIVYNTNGGSFDKQPSDTYVPGEENLLPIDITNGEFIFDGWYTDAECTNRVTRIPTDKIGEFVVYAKWTLEGNVIFYVTNGGEFETAPQTDYSKSRLLASNIYKEGYSFLGWYTDPECTIETETVPVGYEGAYIVYAKWFKSVIIDDTMDEASEGAYNYVECEGHADTDGNGICDICKVCTDIAACHARGKTSSCSVCGRAWSKERPENKISAASGNMGMKDYAAVKYSKVDVGRGDTALRVDIQYKTDDGLFYIGRNVTTNALDYFSENGNMLAKEFVFSIDLAKVEGKNTPTFEIRFFKERQAFLYVSDGKVYIKREANDAALITELTTDLQTIEITFNIEKLAQGTVTYSVYSPAQGKTISRTINGTNAEDVLFQWRFNSSKDTAFIVDNIRLTVPAKEAVKNSIVYNLNGGSFDSTPETLYTPGEEFILPEPHKAGASFDGWYLNPDFSDEPIGFLPEDSFGTVQLYARWIEYKIDYNTNGGEFDGEYNSDYNAGSRELSTNVKKAGYTFLGWYTEPSFKNKVTAVPEGYVGAYAVYACWIKTDLVNETMTGLSVSSSNWVECATHADTNTDGKCETCGFCYDYSKCRGSEKAATTCGTCGRAWTKSNMRVTGWQNSNGLEIKNYAGAKASIVSVNNSDALRIDVQKHVDDGIFYIGNKNVSSNSIVTTLSNESGDVLVSEIEFSIDLALVDGKNAVSFAIRAFKSRATVLEVKSDGRVFLGGEKDGYLITTLTSEMQTITISIGTANVADGKLNLSAFSTAQDKDIARQISGTPNKDGQAEDCLLQWRFGGATNAALLIDNIKLTVPEIY